MKKRRNRFYFKHKLPLYFDENFPKDIVYSLRENNYWIGKIKIYSVFDYGYEGRDDLFQFNFCKDNGFLLVTQDEGFWNDNKYPLEKSSGTVVIVSKKDINSVTICLVNLIDFLSSFPFPKNFAGESKFKVSLEGCVMKGRTSITRRLKTIAIKKGDTVEKIAKDFEYFDRK